MSNRTSVSVQRLEPVIVGAIIATIYFIQSLSSVMHVGAFNDDGVYAALGKSIAEGRGYLSIHLIGAPVHPKFPPVFPSILALFWKLTGSIQGVQQLVGIVHPIVIGVAAAMLWSIGRGQYNVSRAVLAVLVIPMLLFDAAIQYYTIPLSEPWFILGCTLAIFCWCRAEQHTESQMRWVIVASLSVALTILVRSQGFALVPALAFSLLRREFKSRERIAAAIALIVPLAAWYVYHSALLAHGPRSNLPDDITYDTWMRAGFSITSVLGVVATNAVYYVRQFGTYFSSSAVLGATIASMLFASMVVASIAVAKRAPMVAIPVLAGIVMVLLWPFAQDRLLLSILPFAGLALGIALSPVLHRRAARMRGVMNVAAAAIVIAFIAMQTSIRTMNITSFAAGSTPPTFSPGYMLLVNSRFIAEASAWVRANTARGAHVMVDNHPGIYLYSGRETMPVNPAESRMQKSVFEKPGHYLASHILSDSITDIIIGLPSEGIVRDIMTIRERCPAVLSSGAGPNDPRSISVRSDPACLGKLVE